MVYLGIDIGSLTCDAVLIDDRRQVVAWSVVPTGARNAEAIRRAKEEVLSRAGVSPDRVVSTVSTGYGRNRVPGRAAAVTEITCHAKGISAVLPGTGVLIDIGGQDSKAIRLDARGRVLEFAMNDKCAAGTGRFLEAMARVLEMDLEEMSEAGARARGGLTISNMCTVFAESEVVSLIAEGTEVAEIVWGLHQAVATRTRALAGRVARDLRGLKVAMSGGVARNPGVVHALEEVLGCRITVPDAPDTIGALGAALIALERTRQA